MLHPGIHDRVAGWTLCLGYFGLDRFARMGERYITVINRTYGKNAGPSKGIEYLGEKMKELPQINAELENRIINIITDGNQCDDNKECKAASDKYDKAYDILPEPKFERGILSAWLTGSYFNACFALGNFSEEKIGHVFSPNIGVRISMWGILWILVWPHMNLDNLMKLMRTFMRLIYMIKKDHLKSIQKIS